MFLLGIFTRYREESKGCVIYCQYISQINQLLEENYMLPLPYSFIGGPGLTQEFFSCWVNKAVSDLGPRFNEKLNFRLPIVSCFDALGKENKYKKKIEHRIDRWLLNKERFEYGLNDYLKRNSNEINEELQKQHTAVKEFVINWFTNVAEKWKDSVPIPIEQLDEKIKHYNDFLRINSKVTDPKLDLTVEEDRIIRKRSRHIYEQIELNEKLLQELEELNINLFNYPFLLIKGDAGCGKSHLLGDIAKQKLKEEKPVILLLGQQFMAGQTIGQNIVNLLDYAGTLQELLNGLNEIGKQINSRVLFMIDALNEGGGKELWKNGLAGFIKEIESYPFIGFVITVRSTYYDSVVPSQVHSNPNITEITHKGFRGNEYAALRLFCEYYGLKQPQFPILNPEFASPLFLHFICQAATLTSSREIPLCFGGLTNVYVDYLNYIEKNWKRNAVNMQHTAGL
ncbi:MAG: ATP-binding protein [Tannerellaceae bacterium]|nr:ATP-binding protein [Tannerellaceae bacterium]